MATLGNLLQRRGGSAMTPRNVKLTLALPDPQGGAPTPTEADIALLPLSTTQAPWSEAGPMPNDERHTLTEGSLMTDPRHFCMDCKVDTIDRARAWDYYMVRDNLWLQFGVGSKMLCLGCFAQRLSRPLEASDFTLAPINRINPLVAALWRVTT